MGNPSLRRKVEEQTRGYLLKLPIQGGRARKECHFLGLKNMKG